MSKRRSNKSHKVPNVKLRPAQAVLTPLSTQNTTVIWAADSQQPPTSSPTDDVTPRPFRGVVLCLSGVEDKHVLYRKAEELGAAHVAALTDRVTHLVVDTCGSQKYYCAVERSIPILLPSWIEESHKIWLRGDDVELAESVIPHLIPPFIGLTIALSNIPSIVRRAKIIKHITDNGGTYVPKIERPVKVTHLICGAGKPKRREGEEENEDAETAPEPDEARKYAEKFNQRGEANILMVWEEWFWDSLSRGGRFEESKYDVRRPKPPKLAPAPIPAPAPHDSDADTTNNTTTSINARSLPRANSRMLSRTNSCLNGASSFSQVPSAGASKLRSEIIVDATPTEGNAAPAPASSDVNMQGAGLDDQEEEELASVNRTPAVTLQVWSSLLKHRGYEQRGGVLRLSPSKQVSRARVAQEGNSDTEDEEEERRGGGGLGSDDEFTDGFKRRKSVLGSFKRTKSFVVPEASTSRSRLGRSFTTEGALGRLGAGNVAPAAASDDGDGFPEASTSRAADGAELAMDVDPAGGSVSTTPPAPQFFADKTILLLGEASVPSVQDTVVLHGGRVIDEANWDGDLDGVDWAVVRLTSGTAYFLSAKPSMKPKFRTECWLERCIFEERIVAVPSAPSLSARTAGFTGFGAEEVGMVPIVVPKGGIPGAGKVLLSYSGLDEPQTLLVRRLVRLLGIPLSLTFHPRVTHLVCPARTGLKYDKALEWRVKVVDLSWLGSVASKCRIDITGDSGSGSEGQSTMNSLQKTSASRNGPIPPPAAREKGKGKATDPPGDVVPVGEDDVFQPTGSLDSIPLPPLPPARPRGQRSVAASVLPPAPLRTPPRKQAPPNPKPALRSAGANRTRSESECTRNAAEVAAIDTDNAAAGPSKAILRQHAHTQETNSASHDLLSFGSFGNPRGIRAQSSFRQPAKPRFKGTADGSPDDGDEFAAVFGDAGEGQEYAGGGHGQQDEGYSDEMEMLGGAEARREEEEESSFNLPPFDPVLDRLSSPSSSQNMFRVPSSASPSPMKIPPSVAAASRAAREAESQEAFGPEGPATSPPASPSPLKAKPPPPQKPKADSSKARSKPTSATMEGATHCPTKLAVDLQESLASLLGKRARDDEQSGAGGGESVGAGESAAEGGAKRPRGRVRSNRNLALPREPPIPIPIPIPTFSQPYHGDIDANDSTDAAHLLTMKRPEDMTIRYDYSEGVEERKKIREALGGGGAKRAGKSLKADSASTAGGGSRRKSGRTPGF